MSRRGDSRYLKDKQRTDQCEVLWGCERFSAASASQKVSPVMSKLYGRAIPFVGRV